MRILMTGLIVLGVAVSIPHAESKSDSRPAIANEEDFRRAMKELSNWGRWGADDELGAANLITPAKRKQALALAKEGVTISLAHDVVQEKAVDAPNILERNSGQRKSDRHHQSLPIYRHVSRSDSQPSGFGGLSHDGRRQRIQQPVHGRHQR